jgi:hypothetical protein
MWRSLQAIAGDHAAMEGTDFDDLIDRGEAQRRTLEAERMEAGASVLRGRGD